MKRANQIFILSLFLGIMLLTVCSAFSLSDWLKDLFGKNSYSISSGNCLCSSCSSCNFALKDSSCSSVKLANDISFNSAYCLFANQENKIIDCQNYKISNQNSKGIGVYIKANNININNCFFSNLRRGIFVLNSRGVSLNNLNINRTTDSSISLKDSQTNLNNIFVYSGLNGILIKNSNANLNNIVSCRKSSAGKDIFVESSSIIKNNISCDSSQGVSCDKSCSSSCTENWTCTAWGACSYDYSKNPPVSRTRTCRDTNNCGTTLNKPDETIRTASCCDEERNSYCSGDYLINNAMSIDCSEISDRVFCENGCLNYACIKYNYTQYNSGPFSLNRFGRFFSYSSPDGKNRLSFEILGYIPAHDPDVVINPVFSTFYYISNDYGQNWKQIAKCQECDLNPYYSWAVLNNNSYFLTNTNDMSGKIQFPTKSKIISGNISFRGYYTSYDLDSGLYYNPQISSDGKTLLYGHVAYGKTSDLIISKDYGKTWRTILGKYGAPGLDNEFSSIHPLKMSSDGKIITAIVFESYILNKTTGESYLSPRKIYNSNDSGASFKNVFEPPISNRGGQENFGVGGDSSYEVGLSAGVLSMSKDGRVQAFLSPKILDSSKGFIHSLELFISSDYGQTWRNIFNYSCQNNSVICNLKPSYNDLIVSSDGSKIIFYAGKDDNIRIFESKYLYDHENEVFISNNFGESFNSIYNNIQIINYTLFSVKTSSNFNKLILINGTNLLISNDYGQNWRIVPDFCPGCDYNIAGIRDDDGFIHDAYYSPISSYIVSEDGNYISFPGLPGEPDIYSNDGGLTWNKRINVGVYRWI